MHSSAFIPVPPWLAPLPVPRAYRTPLGWVAGGCITPRLTRDALAPTRHLQPDQPWQQRATESPHPPGNALSQRQVPELIPVGKISQNHLFR